MLLPGSIIKHLTFQIHITTGNYTSIPSMVPAYCMPITYAPISNLGGDTGNIAVTYATVLP